MAPLLQSIRISASPDGLLLLPSFSPSPSPDPKQQQQQQSGLKIHWRSARISPVSPDPAQNPSPPAPQSHDPSPPTAIEVPGLLGILDLASSSRFLIAISAREKVAEIRGCAVHRVKDVVLVPLSGRREAEGALRKLAGGNGGDAEGKGKKGAEERAKGAETDESDVPGDEDAVREDGSLDEGEDGDGDGERKENPRKRERAGSRVARDVIQQRGRYGRFAVRWFSRGGGGREGVRRRQGMSPTGNRDEGSEGEMVRVKSLDGRVGEGRGGVIEALAPRILRSARMFFGSSGFYFSYEYDLTRGFAEKVGREAPWERCEPLYFWNRHLLQPFTDAGFDGFALPVIQGFVGQREFAIARTEGDDNDVVVGSRPKSKSSAQKQESIPLGDWNKKPSIATEEFVLTLISRRSVKRAGLRYLRRGIDEEGNVANNVETEQILTSKSLDTDKKDFTLTQIRGSMPLFFKQSPYSFKPVPEMFGSDATNQAAFKKHFTKVLNRYGDVHAVSLVDRHGTENSIGEAYEQRVRQANESGGINGKSLDLEWFDFHGVCKGMKFENVSLLLDALGASLTSFSWTEYQRDQIKRQQSGVFRTNCMDCLDRTNVVQSAIAGHILQTQLATLDLQIDLQLDPRTQWFNTLWADNGDAISRQYAGTAALKGDFTRTRKRNWTGALSDFSLTLNRYYNNIFSDYFLQTCIDYFLGNTDLAVFEDFETDMMSKDYAINMQQIRANAIESCEKIVLEDPDEKLSGAWTLSCPREANTLRTLPFEECVLLLTKAAVYFCRMDWTTEKLESFERVDLQDIVELYKGPYITSALGKTHLDERRNWGFVLRFKARDGGILRKNTRSLLSEEEVSSGDSVFETAKKAVIGGSEHRLLAFKALPPKDTASKGEDWESADLSETDIIADICEEIHHAILDASPEDVKKNGTGSPKITRKDIISAEEAKKSTGYVESLGYSLKKLVWS